MTDAELSAVMRGIAPVVRDLIAKELAPHIANLGTMHERLITVERRAALDAVVADVGTLREKVAALEVRAPVPGPPGAPGQDGVGFDDLSVEYDGDRTIALSFSRNGTTKAFPIALPFLKFQDVYQAGRSYVVGDVVLWGGNLWHCKAATSVRPGDAAPQWQLIVRRGRDGRDAPGATA